MFQRTLLFLVLAFSPMVSAQVKWSPEYQARLARICNSDPKKMSAEEYVLYTSSDCAEFRQLLEIPKPDLKGGWIFEDDSFTPLQFVQMSDFEWKEQEERAKRLAARIAICLSDPKELRTFQQKLTYNSDECRRVRLLIADLNPDLKI